MLDSRQALTTWLENNTNLNALSTTIVQEDEFTEETSRPAIVLTYDGSDEEPGTLFRNERWDFWLVAESNDYYTLGRLAAVLRKDLDRFTLPHVVNAESTILRVKWVGEGPAVFDTTYRVHTQVQSYIAIVFDVEGA